MIAIKTWKHSGFNVCGNGFIMIHDNIIDVKKNNSLEKSVWLVWRHQFVNLGGKQLILI